jgi:hypothetical protein
MKSLLFAILCSCSLFANAQSAIIRHNTVILDNEELFKLYSVGTFTHQTYKVKNLKEEDLILIDQTTLRNDQGTILMKLIFNDMPNAEAYIPMNVSFKKQLARLLANYSVVKNNALDGDAVALFCKNYGIATYPSKYISEELTGTKTETKEMKKVVKREEKPLVETKKETVEVAEVVEENTDEKQEILLDENGLVKRDITQQIYLSGSKIRQDYKEIGSYTAEAKMLLGQEGKQINIFSIKGEKVGIARFINGDEQCELLTVRDNKTWNIPLPKGDMYMIVKDIVRVLCDKMYM